MKTYYSRDGITLILGDCLEVLPTIEAGVIDMVCADPPYGTTACKWDSIIPLKPLWDCLERVIKPRAAIVMTASQPFTTALIQSNQQWFKYCWVWEKGVGTGFLDANIKPLKCHEDIVVFYQSQPTYNPQKWKGTPNHGCRTKARHHKSIYSGEYGRPASDFSGEKFPRSVVKFDKHSSAETLHKSQKPLALIEYLIRTYTNEGDMVLDFCFGSGTTMLAAWNLGRKGIGIESQEEYAEIAAKRIDAEISRGKLFKDEEPEPVEQTSLQWEE